MHSFSPLSSLCLLHSVRILLPVFHLSWLVTCFTIHVPSLVHIHHYSLLFCLGTHSSEAAYVIKEHVAGDRTLNLWLGVENTALTCTHISFVNTTAILLEWGSPNNTMADSFPSNRSINSGIVAKLYILLEPLSSLRLPSWLVLKANNRFERYVLVLSGLNHCFYVLLLTKGNTLCLSFSSPVSPGWMLFGSLSVPDCS